MRLFGWPCILLHNPFSPDGAPRRMFSLTATFDFLTRRVVRGLREDQQSAAALGSTALQPLMAPEKSVKTCQEFGQGSVKDGLGFEGGISISGLLMWLSEPPAAGHTPNSGRGDYLPCYADRSEPLIAMARRLGQIAFRGAIRPELSRIICLLTIGPDCPRRPTQQCPGE